MKVLGLTGPTGAGKGAVSAIFRESYGIPSIDTDRVYHDLLKPPSACLDELVECFGADILNENGELNRPVLSKIVFSDETRQKQERLNHITHKYVLNKTREMLKQYAALGLTAAIVDAPLLYESGFDTECDSVIAVLAPRDIRKERIMTRDQLTEERAIARLNMQKPDSFYTDKTPHILINDGDLPSLKRQVSAIADRLEVGS